MKRSYLIAIIIVIAAVLIGLFVWMSYRTQGPAAYNPPANANMAENTPTVPPPATNGNIPYVPPPTNTTYTPPPAINGPVLPPPAPISPGKSVYLNTVKDAKLGDRLVAFDGMSLYYFTKDSTNTSTCTGTCATTWPPYTVGFAVTPIGDAKATGKIGTITRADGSKQLIYDGVPLYRYSGDKTDLDTNGQGVGGVWYVVKP